ncbi:MAG TPA: redoxin domain-containing protein [Gemmatimonadales bacterium]|nr:redoxin domain-containing protein [Gemmatimonadales bacterium]
MTTATSRLPQVGEEAPDFTLPSTSGSDVSLASFRNSSAVLVAFFPLAFTGTCTTEMCAFSEDFDVFADKGVTVLPVSVDSVPTLREFASKYELRTPLLSDFKRELSSSWGLLRETFASERAYILIDRSGVVRWVHVEDVPSNRRENEEILARIAELP